MEILSKRARYALHGVGYIAAFADEAPVSFDAILSYLTTYSGGQRLSSGYIAKIFQTLSKAGIVTAVSGPGGGYRLSQAARRTRLIEIIEALDGPVMSSCCLLSAGQCPTRAHCGIGILLGDAERNFYDFFKKKSVASLVKQMSFPNQRVGASPVRRRR